MWDARSRTTATSHLSTSDKEYKDLVNEAGEVVLSRLAEVATVTRDPDSGGLVLEWNSARSAPLEPEPVKNGMIIDGAYYIVLLRSKKGSAEVLVEAYDPVASATASIPVPRSHRAIAAVLGSTPQVLKPLQPHLHAKVEDGRLQLSWTG